MGVTGSRNKARTWSDCARLDERIKFICLETLRGQGIQGRKEQGMRGQTYCVCLRQAVRRMGWRRKENRHDQLRDQRSIPREKLGLVLGQCA